MGSRLLSITNDEIPKPMASIAGKPILQWQIERLRENNITSIVIVIGHLGHKIREFFQDGTNFGVSISYIEEMTPLGTAGALSLLPPFLSRKTFLLIFGDVLFDIDLWRMIKFHRKNKAIATLFVHPNSHPYDSDLVVCDSDGRVKCFDSKHNIRDYWYHNCVNAGLYIMESRICSFIPANTKVDLEKQLLTELINNHESIFAYNSPEYIKDVGTVERIVRAGEELQNGFISSRNLMRTQKAIFLDRDGTINQKNGLIYREDQFELESSAIQAVQLINQSGYLAIVVTNQPVVARGLCRIEDVNFIHKKMETLLGQAGAFLDAVLFCPHHPDKGYPEENSDYKVNCHCRKPDTGMLEDCAKRYNIDMSKSWMVGDTTVDIQTGINAGTHTALVLTGDAGKDRKYDVTAELTGSDLLEVVNMILKEGN